MNSVIESIINMVYNFVISSTCLIAGKPPTRRLFGKNKEKRYN